MAKANMTAAEEREAVAMGEIDADRLPRETKKRPKNIEAAIKRQSTKVQKAEDKPKDKEPEIIERSDGMKQLGIFLLQKAGEKIPGGLASGKKEEDFDKEQLDAGQVVEKEHTTDSQIAREIAMDHLTEDKDYYRKLKRIEEGGNGLQKSGREGEGSRGGHVIGHTSGGKPVYEASTSHRQSLSNTVKNAHYGKDGVEQYKGWGKQDHLDAKTIYDNELVKMPPLSSKNDYERAFMLHNMRNLHHNAADAISAVGQTKSGKEIHAPDHGVHAAIVSGEHHPSEHAKLVQASHPHYSAQDHLDAAEHHHKEYDKATKEGVAKFQEATHDPEGAAKMAKEGKKLTDLMDAKKLQQAADHAAISIAHKKAAEAMQGSSKPEVKKSLSGIDSLTEFLEKADSLGKTRSGKNIPADGEGQSWTLDDHIDAAVAHREAAIQALSNNDVAGHDRHLALAEEFEKEAPQYDSRNEKYQDAGEHDYLANAALEQTTGLGGDKMLSKADAFEGLNELTKFVEVDHVGSSRPVSGSSDNFAGVNAVAQGSSVPFVDHVRTGGDSGAGKVFEGATSVAQKDDAGMPTCEPGPTEGTDVSKPVDGGDLTRGAKQPGKKANGAGAPIDAPAPAQEKLSADDEAVNLLEGREPRELRGELMQRSFAPRSAIEMSRAHEDAIRVSQLQKSEEVEAGIGIAPEPMPAQELQKARVWSQGGESMVVYSDGSDLAAEALLKSEYPFGQPSLTPPQSRILAQVLCKSCHSAHSSVLAVCPVCGVEKHGGINFQKSHETVGIPERKNGPLLRPVPIQEIDCSQGVSFPKEK